MPLSYPTKIKAFKFQKAVRNQVRLDVSNWNLIEGHRFH